MPLAFVHAKREGKESMKRAWKWLLPATLLVLVALVFSYGSLAAFTKSFTLDSAAISAKSFTFYVNESTSAQQDLGDATLSVDSSKKYEILLDGRSCETAVDARVTLDVTYDGTWPDGLTVYMDGENANDGFSRTYTDLQTGGEPKNIPLEVVWDDPHVSNYEPYSNFTLHLSVTVAAEQPEA